MQRKDLSNTAKQELFKWLEEEEQQLSRRLNQRAQELLRSSQTQQSPNKKNYRRKPRNEKDYPHKKDDSSTKNIRDLTSGPIPNKEPIGYREISTQQSTN